MASVMRVVCLAAVLFPSAVLAFNSRVVPRHTQFRGSSSFGKGGKYSTRHHDNGVTDRRTGGGLFMNNGGNNDGDTPIDPNPGGLNKWSDDDDNKKSFKDMSFFEQIQEWFASDEGKEDVKTYTVSLSVALLLRLLIIEPRYIPSLSMYPTFEVGDQLAVEKVTKRIRPFNRNEVVVFNPPETFREIVGQSSRKSKEALIKRIVAVEGDQVEVKGGKLFVNGVRQEEPFTAEDAEYQFGPVVVPSGDVLVLGDNRNHSLDGHIWGFLPAENVIGRAVFVYWPPWRVGNTGMF
ncbi:hypothetical protein ACHAWT_005124 [Skeletonema menzelii]|eukprot:scaffold22656_cov147-Skeletonema_menzelii.AAC.6